MAIVAHSPRGPVVGPVILLVAVLMFSPVVATVALIGVNAGMVAWIVALARRDRGTAGHGRAAGGGHHAGYCPFAAAGVHSKHDIRRWAGVTR